jgi:hypothetical protein
MKRLVSKAEVIGFLFGVVGLFILAALALIVPFFEMILAVLAAPSRAFGLLINGPDGSTLEIIILSLFNGILYALIFRVIAYFFGKKSQKVDLT